MNSLKSFVKNIAEKAPEFATSPTKVTGAASHPEDGLSAEGFICPMCMSGFVTPDELQVHFERDHGEEGSLGEALPDLKGQVKDLEASLREEQSHSAQLKKEIERLTQSVQRHPSDLEEDEELVQLQSQIKALQLGKDVSYREIESLKKSLYNSQKESRQSLQTVQDLTLQLAGLSDENSSLKANHDQVLTENLVLQEKAKLLESVLEQRNNSDDVAVLRTELHNVQRLMMDDIQGMKAESKVDQVRVQNKALQDQLHQANLEKETLEVKLATDLSRLKLEYEQSQAARVQAEEASARIAVDLEKLKVQHGDQAERMQRDQDQLTARVATLQEANADLKTQLEDKASFLEDAEAELQQTKVDAQILNDQLDQAKVERQELLTNIESKEGINTALQQLKAQNESLHTQIKNLSTEKQSLLEEHRGAVGKLLVTIKDHKSDLASAKDTIASLNIKAESLETGNSKLSHELHSKAKQVNEAEERNAELQKKCQDEAVLVNQVNLLTQQVKDLEEEHKVSAREHQLQVEHNSKLKDKLTSLEEDIKGFQEANRSQAITLSELEEHSTEVEKRAKTAEVQVSTLQEGTRDLASQLASKNKVCQELEAKNSHLEDQVSQVTDQLANSNFEAVKWQERLSREQTSFEHQKLTLKDSVADLTSARDMLLADKVDLKAKLEEEERLTSSLRQQVNEEKERVLVMRQEGERMEASLREMADSHERELNRMSEESCQLKLQVEKCQTEFTDLNRQLESAVGERLELEAKVGSSADEIRSLLTRCLAAESELDRSRSNVVELRRKLDDSQAALHELGRENQSIQVELAKQTGRKWADDAEATLCSSCQTLFSLTNRKHHCRNCGQIFCKDCSSKQTSMSNYKKPQRVCDPCFAELQLPGNPSGGSG